MVTTSIKTNAEVYGTTATFWPRQPTLQNYRVLFTKTPFAVYFQNSVLIALGTTFITVLASVAQCLRAGRGSASRAAGSSRACSSIHTSSRSPSCSSRSSRSW